MIVQELHPAGAFSSWNPIVLAELQKGNYTTKVGEQLVFENEVIKVWTIKLLPHQSLPFHKHQRNYNWTALTEGSAISHYKNGRVVAINYSKGDLSYYNHDEKGDFIHNLKNTGNTILEFVTIEYKKQ